MTTPLAPMQCLVGNCTSWAECRSLDLVMDCPQEPGHSGDIIYSSCITEIVQKGTQGLSLFKEKGQKVGQSSLEISLLFVKRALQNQKMKAKNSLLEMLSWFMSIALIREYSVSISGVLILD